MRVKICGITKPADAEAASDAGADAVGINFYPKSPRYVPPTAAVELLKAVPPLVTPVGVFVHDELRQVSASAYQLGVRAVQWYGEERVDDMFPFSLIPAFRVRDEQSLIELKEFLADCRRRGVRLGGVLVDGYVRGQMGGTGTAAPWDLLADFDAGVPLILAGGLTPDYVADAVRRVKPWGVDVASGVESAPGVKDPEKMRRFVDAAREGAASIR